MQENRRSTSHTESCLPSPQSGLPASVVPFLLPSFSREFASFAAPHGALTPLGTKMPLPLPSSGRGSGSSTSLAGSAAPRAAFLRPCPDDAAFHRLTRSNRTPRIRRLLPHGHDTLAETSTPQSSAH